MAISSAAHVRTRWPGPLRGLARTASIFRMACSKNMASVLPDFKYAPTRAVVFVVLAASATTVASVLLYSMRPPDPAWRSIPYALLAVAVGAVFILGKQRPQNVGIGLRHTLSGVLYTGVLLVVLFIVWRVYGEGFGPTSTVSAAVHLRFTFAGFFALHGIAYVVVYLHIYKPEVSSRPVDVTSWPTGLTYWAWACPQRSCELQACS